MTTTNPTEAPTGRRRGPSMADVAREASVSGQTVSRVSNGRNNVDAETRERVLAAMRKLGYRPNSAARALRTGRFHSIGVIMFTLSSYGNMRTLDAIASAATDAGYSITLIPVPHPTQGEVSVALERLSEEAVDGVIIIVEAHLLDEGDVALPPDLPVVVVDSAGRDRPIVDTDQAHGAMLATEHLLGLGHRTVWHVAGPERSYSAERRRASWESTLRAHGAEVPPVLVGDWSSESGHELGLELARDPEVTAVFAANDQMALGVLRAPARGRPRRARRGERRRLRRHGRVGELLAAAHDRAAVLRRGRPAARSRRSCTRSRPASATAPRSSPPSSSCATARRRRRAPDSARPAPPAPRGQGDDGHESSGCRCAAASSATHSSNVCTPRSDPGRAISVPSRIARP